MNPADIENFLAQGLNLMGLSLDNQPEALSRLAFYFHELKKWNKKINLVARTMDDHQILENHFLDSLTLLSFWTLKTKNRKLCWMLVLEPVSQDW